ncbi:MAG: hypothetical protein RDV41_14245, partial [Planctomycetota bacterium]|nr:hypothetical protein [Planctomycetota bacterium]
MKDAARKARKTTGRQGGDLLERADRPGDIAVTPPHVERIALAAIARETSGDPAGHLVTRASGETVRAKVEGAVAGLPDPVVFVLDFDGTGIIDFSCADELVAKLVSRLIAGEYGDRYMAIANTNDGQRENMHVALERKELAVLAWKDVSVKPQGGEWAQHKPAAAGPAATRVLSGDRMADGGSGAGEATAGVGPALEARQSSPDVVAAPTAPGGSLEVVRRPASHLLLGALNPHLRQALELVMSGRASTAKDVARLLKIELNTAGTRLINLHKRR